MLSVERHSGEKCLTHPWAVLLGSWLLLTLRGLGQARPPGLSEFGDNDPYKISVDVKLVLLPASVTDRKGHAIPDLRGEDFRVYEDGRPQKIVLFKHEDIPLTVGLVVDGSSSMRAKRPKVAEAVLAFAQSSNPQDQMFVVNFSDTASLGLPDNILFTDQLVLLSRCLSLAPGGRTALYDAIALALNHLKQGTRPKKALIVVSDGGDNSSHYRLREVLHMAETSNAVVYTIGLLDVHEMDQNPAVLRRIAKVTGGEAYFPDTLAEVKKVFQDIARDLREQYTLGYVPPSPESTGSYRSLRVHVVAPRKGKIRVRSRRGYYTPASGTPAQPAAQGDQTEGRDVGPDVSNRSGSLLTSIRHGK